jgi:hypothetical protein
LMSITPIFVLLFGQVLRWSELSNTCSTIDLNKQNLKKLQDIKLLEFLLALLV